MVKMPVTVKWLVVFALFLFAFELLLRFCLGLGSPALTVEHPRIEYMFAPNQEIKRFGNRFKTNPWGMRSENFPRWKLDHSQLRILVIGDSIVNGGHPTDHSRLATTIVQRTLEKQLNRSVVVGNISAGSWGPGNWLAYVQEFGFFDSDYFIIVAGSADYLDTPTFEPLNPNTHPTRNPLCATSELFQRYLAKYVPKFTSAPKSETTENDLADDIALEDLSQLILLAKRNVSKVGLIQYLARVEIIESQTANGYVEIKGVAESTRIPSLDTRTWFKPENSSIDFRDEIHPNDAGQKLLAKAILTLLSSELQLAIDPNLLCE